MYLEAIFDRERPPADRIGNAHKSNRARAMEHLAGVNLIFTGTRQPLCSMTPILLHLGSVHVNMS